MHWEYHWNRREVVSVVTRWLMKGEKREKGMET
jgi:hypothetical protein